MTLHDWCLIIILQVPCHGFVARLKVCLMSYSTSIIDLNPSKEYVKTFSQEINATHDKRCYYRAELQCAIGAIEMAIDLFRSVFVDTFTSF